LGRRGGRGRAGFKAIKQQRASFQKPRGSRGLMLGRFSIRLQRLQIRCLGAAVKRRKLTKAERKRLEREIIKRTHPENALPDEASFKVREEPQKLQKAAQTGDHIEFSFKARDEKGKVVSSTPEDDPEIAEIGEEPIFYSGVKEAFIGKRPGDSFTLKLSPEARGQAYSKDLVRSIVISRAECVELEMKKGEDVLVPFEYLIPEDERIEEDYERNVEAKVLGVYRVYDEDGEEDEDVARVELDLNSKHCNKVLTFEFTLLANYGKTRPKELEDYMDEENADLQKLNEDFLSKYEYADDDELLKNSHEASSDYSGEWNLQEEEEEGDQWEIGNSSSEDELEYLKFSRK
jgi:hypothetical protein